MPAEDQANEFEALQSIYPNEITFQTVHQDVLKLIQIDAPASEVQTEFQIQIPSMFDGYDFDLLLHLRLPIGYPDDPLTFEIQSDGIDDDVVERWLQDLQQSLDDNVGQVVVFVLVQQLSELQDQHIEQLQIQQETSKLAIKAVEEEKESRKFQGTPVTKESFGKWKAKFDQEHQLNQVIDTTLTGKQLFLQNKISNVEDDDNNEDEGVEFIKQNFEEDDEVDAV